MKQQIVCRWVALVFFVFALSMNAMAQQNPPKPLMGWNSWDSYGMYPTQEAMLKNLDVMARRLKPFGYTYFVIDAGWNKLKDADGKINGMSVNEYSLYVPNPQTFSGGLKAVADRAHALGLKFGVHIMRGISRIAWQNNTPIKGTTYRARGIADTTSLCRWNSDNYGVNMAVPGAQAYYDSYIEQLVDWGVDFIKADDITGHPDEVKAVVEAIRKTGKPVVLSLSPGGDTKQEYMKIYNTTNMVRVTKDIWDNDAGIERAFTAWKEWTAVPGRNFLLDMDMIPFGHLNLNHPDPNFRFAVQDEKRHGQNQREHMSFFTTDQKYTFITLRALSASPLFMGGDLPTTDDFSFALLTNKDMIACNQNGVTGQQVYSRDGVEVWKAESRTHPGEGWIGVFNRNKTAKAAQLSNADLGMPAATMRLFNVWENKDLQTVSEQKPLAATLNADGVLFCRYTITKK